MEWIALERRSAILAVAAMALAGCDRPTLAKKPTPDALAGYLQPPRTTGVVRREDGSLRLTGAAPPRAEVRLRAPEGERLTARADADGRWTLSMPAPAAPRLFAVEAEASGGRVLKGEGALAVLPGEPFAAVLRPGYATRWPGTHTARALRLLAVDFDGSGFAASALAPPSTPVRLVVDGAVISIGQSDPLGAVALLAVDPRHPVRPGVHTVRLETPAGLSTEQTVTITAPKLPADRFYAASAEPDGWRIDWRPPGGGVQGARIFSAAAAGSRG